MSNFQKAQAFVKPIEGDYTDQSSDKGNWTGNKVGSGRLIGTKYGISAPVLNAYYKSKYSREANKSDMRDLRYETAVSILKSQYWDKYNLDLVGSYDLQLIIYDGIVNHGGTGMRNIVQKALSNLGKQIQSSDVFKTKGLNAINSSQPKELFDKIKSARKAFYQNLSSFNTFGTGWMNRLDSIPYTGQPITAATAAVGNGMVKVGVQVVNAWPIFFLGVGMLSAGLFLTYKG